MTLLKYMKHLVGGIRCSTRHTFRQSQLILSSLFLETQQQSVAAISEIIQDGEELQSTLLQTSVKSQDSQEAKSKYTFIPLHFFFFFF